MLRRYTDTPYAVVNVLFDIVAILLGLRFAFRLLAANTAHWLTSALYAVTDPLVLPFRGLFPNVVIGGGVVEWNAIVALVAYSVIAILLLRLFAAFSVEPEQEVFEERRLHHRRRSHAS